MNKTIKTAAALSVLVASGAMSGVASAEVTGNIGVTSNYIWRGVTQTGDAPAVQGGVDYAHESGFYAGTWLSNVDFSETSDRNEYEQDLYLGFAGAAGDFGYDVGVFHYMYPLSDNADFTELGLSGSYKMVSAGVNYTVSSDVEDTDAGAEVFIEGDLYYYAGLNFDLGSDLGLGLLAGAYNFEDDGQGGADLDYVNYQISLSKGDFTFAYDQNDIDGVDAAGKKFDDPRFSVSWTKEF